MERLEQLRRRVDGAESLRSITGAMKALASVRIRGFREMVAIQADYRETLEAAFKVALRDAPSRPLDVGEDGGQSAGAGLIVFGSDLGLVGQFNADISVFAAERIREIGDVVHVAAVGSRPLPHLRAAGIDPSSVLPVPVSPGHLNELAQDLVLLIESWRREGIGKVAVAHHSYRAGAHYGPRWQGLLPLDPDWLRSVASRSWSTRVLPTYRASWESLFRYLVREQLYVSLVRAAAESQASEHAGRLAAMERAERRIDEHLDELRRRLRDRRQEAIDEELLDLMTGFQASQEAYQV